MVCFHGTQCCWVILFLNLTASAAASSAIKSLLTERADAAVTDIIMQLVRGATLTLGACEAPVSTMSADWPGASSRRGGSKLKTGLSHSGACRESSRLSPPELPGREVGAARRQKGGKPSVIQ